MINLYILTERRFPNLHEDDSGLLSSLKKVGIHGIPTIWTDFTLNTSANVLIRTPWDYTHYYEKFFDVLNNIERSKCICINSIEILKWNINKKYLLDLENFGIKIVPTRIIYNFSLADIKRIEHDYHFPIVIKPLIGAGGKDTFLLHDRENIFFCQNLIGHDVLIQPFIESIKTHGEYSYVFFGNIFSHAVVKQNRPEEFRVQSEYGGTVTKYNPTKKELDMVYTILQKTNKYFPYLRLDLVYYQDNLVIMELEAIEPELFFRFSDNAVDVFARTIAQELS